MRVKLSNLVGFVIAMASLTLSSSAVAETEDRDIFGPDSSLRGAVSRGATDRELEGDPYSYEPTITVCACEAGTICDCGGGDGGEDGDAIQVTVQGIPAEYNSPHPDAGRGVEIEVILDRDNEPHVNGDVITMIVGKKYRWRAMTGGIAGPWQQHTAGPATWDVSAAFSEIKVARRRSLETIEIRGSKRVLTRGQPFTVAVGATLFLRGVSPYAVGGDWHEYEVPAGPTTTFSANSGVTTTTAMIPDGVQSRDGSPVKVTLIPFGDKEMSVPFSEPFLFPRGSKIRLQVEVNGIKSKVAALEVADVANTEINVGAALTQIDVIIPERIKGSSDETEEFNARRSLRHSGAEGNSDVYVYLNRFEEPFTESETVYLPFGSMTIVLTKIELGKFTYAPRKRYQVRADDATFEIDTTEHFDGISGGVSGCR